MSEHRKHEDAPKFFYAILNGNETVARKMGNTWIVGGDKIQKGDNVMIALTKGMHTSWYKLKGAVFHFDDHLTENEYTKRRIILDAAIAKARGQ